MSKLADDQRLILRAKAMEVIEDPQRPLLVELARNRLDRLDRELRGRHVELAQQVLVHDVERGLRPTDPAVRDRARRPGRRERARQRRFADAGNAIDHRNGDALQADREPRELRVPPDEYRRWWRNSNGRTGHRSTVSQRARIRRLHLRDDIDASIQLEYVRAMGFRCRWLATRGRDREAVLCRLKFKVVAEIAEPVYDTGLYALEVDEWLVVIGDGFDHMGEVKRAQAAKLSDEGDVMYLYTDDSAMAFELAMFSVGKELWSIAYDGGDGVTAPTLEGAVPREVRALLAKLEKEQAKAGGPKADVDHIYELAPTYAKEVVGFRNDESLSSGDHVPVWQLAAKR